MPELKQYFGRIPSKAPHAWLVYLLGIIIGNIIHAIIPLLGGVIRLGFEIAFVVQIIANIINKVRSISSK